MVVTNVQPVTADSNTLIIKSGGSLDPPDANVQVEKNVYTLNRGYNRIQVQRNSIVLDGNGYTIADYSYDGPPVVVLLVCKM